MKKLGLKVLAVTLSITNLVSFSPIKINAAEQQTISQPKTSDTNLNKNLKEESKALKILKAAGIGAGVGVTVYVGLQLMVIGGLTVADHFMIEKIKKEHLEKFKGNIEPNKLTKCQEGAGWCWLACLQTLLKIKGKGFEKTQKELYKEITDKSPGWFKVTRPNALLLRGSFGDDLIANFIILTSVSVDLISKYISENTNYEFIPRRIVCDNFDSDAPCNLIKDIYKNNIKGPFSILDSLCSFNTGNVTMLHFVNVVEICENDDIIIECPTTGLRRTESLKDFVKRYNENEYFKTDGVNYFYLASKSSI